MKFSICVDDHPRIVVANHAAAVTVDLGSAGSAACTVNMETVMALNRVDSTAIQSVFLCKNLYTSKNYIYFPRDCDAV